VEYRQHDDASLLDPVKDGVRKAACPNAPDVAVRQRVALRMLGERLDGASNLCNELRAETASAVLVPQGSFVEFRFCGTPKDNGERHALRRFVSEA
jgi:hypothetical protein